MVLLETQSRPNEFGTDDKGPSAPHGDIALFALCDGSVRAISETIDPTAYNALATRAGEEVVEQK